MHVAEASDKCLRRMTACLPTKFVLPPTLPLSCLAVFNPSRHRPLFFFLFFFLLIFSKAAGVIGLAASL